jgi:hypothetical protein
MVNIGANQPVCGQEGARMYEIKRFPHDGTVDADGHVLEPAWLWQRYLEARFESGPTTRVWSTWS